MGLDWVGEIFQKRGVEKMKQLEKVRYNVKHEEETEAAIKQVELEKELLKRKKSKDNQMESIRLEYEDLKVELVRLRKYLDYKNSGFCKRYLEKLIRKYFKN